MKNIHEMFVVIQEKTTSKNIHTFEFASVEATTLSVLRTRRTRR